ncbi:hypothetical protein L1987_60194 [Smallanthus sonchifolius]|uniref:Uncharacterized protein n=1 Tax=Smallanthus sonchifolius TaxID=185202 RepID=A0ACB9D7L2_9ASTR|nr:hypothetical protein L1987_60194 [Smallanthus sonchifolius]
MDMFMFDTSDLQNLYVSPIRIGAGNATKDVGKLYMRVVTRALKMRKEALELKKKLRYRWHQTELKEKYFEDFVFWTTLVCSGDTTQCRPRAWQH